MGKQATSHARRFVAREGTTRRARAPPVRYLDKPLRPRLGATSLTRGSSSQCRKGSSSGRRLTGTGPHMAARSGGRNGSQCSSAGSAALWHPANPAQSREGRGTPRGKRSCCETSSKLSP